MNIADILPVFIMFCVWGLKPGPHTLTLLVRTASHGARTGLAIALGNNLVHLILFWFAWAAVSWVTVSGVVFNVVGIAAGGVIVFTALRDNMFKRKFDATESVKGFRSAVVAGAGVALSNPLNLTFYLALTPELANSRITFGSAVLLSTSVYLALLLGQGFYIGLANTLRHLLEDREHQSTFVSFSNLLFGLLGVYVICRSALRLVV